MPETIGPWDKIKLLNQSGLSYKDIGGILGIKDSSVRSALSRSKDKVPKEVGQPDTAQDSVDAPPSLPSEEEKQDSQVS